MIFPLIIQNYLKIESCFLSCVTFVIALVLGPWTGLQIALMDHEYQTKVLLALCSTFYIVNLFLLNEPGSLGKQGLWLISYNLFLLGHWIHLVHYETTWTNPKSKSELFSPMVVITVISAIVQSPPIMVMIHRACCRV